MMGLFLLVIFTQATRAGNNSKAETFPLGRREGAAVRALVAAARVPASRDRAVSGQDRAPGSSRLDAMPHGVSSLVTASSVWESKSFGSTCHGGRESWCTKLLAELYLGISSVICGWVSSCGHRCLCGWRQCLEVRRANTSHTCNEQAWDYQALVSPALVTSARVSLVHSSMLFLPQMLAAVWGWSSSWNQVGHCSVVKVFCCWAFSR